MHSAWRSILLAQCAFAIAGAPLASVRAQIPDSSGMPSLELLAAEAGRASRRHPIRAVAAELLCEPAHPLVDSASAAACSTLDTGARAALTAAFARGLEVPLAARAASPTSDEQSACPSDLERRPQPRVVLARLTAPIVGELEGRWEGRITVEFRCRMDGGSEGALQVIGKEYLYQWTGTAWRLYQFAWRRTRL